MLYMYILLLLSCWLKIFALLRISQILRAFRSREHSFGMISIEIVVLRTHMNEDTYEWNAASLNFRIHMCPHSYVCSLLISVLRYSFALICTHLHSSALICAHLRSFALICAHLHSFALICTHLHSFALICTHLHSFALICTHLHYQYLSSDISQYSTWPPQNMLYMNVLLFKHQRGFRWRKELIAKYLKMSRALDTHIFFFPFSWWG